MDSSFSSTWLAFLALFSGDGVWSHAWVRWRAMPETPGARGGELCRNPRGEAAAAGGAARAALASGRDGGGASRVCALLGTPAGPPAVRCPPPPPSPPASPAGICTGGGFDGAMSLPEGPPSERVGGGARGEGLDPVPRRPPLASMRAAEGDGVCASAALKSASSSSLLSSSECTS